MTKPITRFAPSPTGHLHIGGARTAIFNWLLARNTGGKFFLRIEDTDTERSLQEYTDSILASMRWLGLDWDGELTYQSKRFDLYNEAIDTLLANGQAYWCECSPEEVETMREKARAEGGKPCYNGRCRERKLGPGAGHVVRIKAPQTGTVHFNDIVKGPIAIDASELDDMIIRRSDGAPTYNLAVVVDDLEMGVNTVIRGDDHVSNTPKQIIIYQALGKPVPQFGHVPMILGPDKKKLSKRHGARAVVEYQEDGLLPQALVNYLVRLGWSYGDQEIFELKELIEKFSLNSLSSSPSAFDPEKLAWLNAHYMRATPADELGKIVHPFVVKEGFTIEAETLSKYVPLYAERATNLIELAQAMRPLLVTANTLEIDAKAGKAISDESKEHLRALAIAFTQCPDFTATSLEAVIHTYVESNNLKFKQVGPVLRAALTGTSGGPSLPDILAVLGKEESLSRINKVLAL